MLFNRIRALFIFTCVLTLCSAGRYLHLGCFKDSAVSNSYDLRGKEVTFEKLTLASCATQCAQGGYPYAAMQEGEKCFCGDTYGAYGLATDSAKSCNYTCDSASCGGYLANDIYYTVDQDTDQKAARVLVYHDTQLQFIAARQQCVKYKGDLAMTLDSATLNDTVYTALNVNPDESSIWLGLRRDLDKRSSSYQWVDPSETTYTSSSFSSRWKTGDSQNQDCVQITTATQLWASASCDFQLRFVCWQLPISETNDGGNGNGGKTGDGSNGGFDTKLLSLYVVLPLFLFCYGGSCILYCSSKLYKNCKRQKRQKMLLANMDNHATEYEPETKPPAAVPPPPMGMPGLAPPPRAPVMANNRGASSPRPLSASKNSKVSPAPAPMMQSDPMGQGGKQGMHPGGPAAPQRAPYPPPPIPSKPPQYSSQPADMFTARSESRPLTSGGVEISMQESQSAGSSGRSSGTAEGAPMSARSRSKDEVKKAKLLDKALNEARERRRQEAIARGEDPDARTNSRLQETALDGRGSERSRSKDRNRESRYAVNNSSGDSTKLLIDMETADSPTEMEGPPRDPTKMSIQDILKMKVAMNQGRRKKIISA